MHFVADIITLYAIWTVVEIEFVSRVFLAVSLFYYTRFSSRFFFLLVSIKLKGLRIYQQQ